jgi:large subunit ribosomal protein L1
MLKFIPKDPKYIPKLNRANFKRNQKLQRQSQHPENISFSQAISSFRPYTLGMDVPLSLHVELSDSASQGKIVRGEVALQHQLTDQGPMRVLVFAEQGQAEAAKKLGATIVGDEELIATLTTPEAVDALNVSRILSTKAMFPKVVRIAKILGPKGLMPSPAKGTVSDDLQALLSSLQFTTKYEADSEKMVKIDIAKVIYTLLTIL